MKKYLFLICLVINTYAIAQESLEPLISEHDNAIDSKIIGGTQVTDSTLYPWMVGILYSNQFDAFFGQFCGGSLIASSWVLTAAHCVKNTEDPSSLDIVVGRLQLSDFFSGERISVVNIIRHPDYNPITQDSDLALLQLARPSRRLPVELVNQHDDTLIRSGTNVRVMGWGRTIENDRSSYPHNLRHVSLTTVSDFTCLFSLSGLVTSNMFCAGIREGGKDTCKGDSGGPLVVANNNTFTQVGITSWGNGCARPNKYGVYTRLSSFRNFIDETIGTPVNLDVDGNNEVDALTDGILIIRYLFGFTGDELICNAIANNASRTTANDIESYLIDIENILDIDGNGQTDALTDGVLIIRFLFGFTGSLLTNDVVSLGATRTPFEIESYISGFSPDH